MWRSSGGKPFDVVIVGAGVVGVFCAVQLERRGLRVALVEGGDLTPDTLSNATYTEIAGRAHSTVDSGRAMGLGGTGCFGAASCRNSAPPTSRATRGFGRSPTRSFARCTTVSTPRWACRRAWTMPPHAFVSAATRELWMDVERIFSYWLPNPNLASVFRETISRSPALAVFTRCKAVGLSFDENGRARRVKVRTPSGPATIAADRVVISGGVVESARFALAARREENCPWRDNARHRHRVPGPHWRRVRRADRQERAPVPRSLRNWLQPKDEIYAEAAFCRRERTPREHD